MLNPADSTSQSQNRKVGGVEFDLPDDLAIEILSRLRAVDVVRLRSVCKRWRDLTSSHNFTLLHRRRCPPMLLFEEYCYEDEFLGWEHYLLDQWWEPLPATPKIYQFRIASDFPLCLSNGGLLAMGNCRDYLIMNPVFQEEVRITLPEEFQRSQIYGVFFHPSLEEFCTLWRITVSIETERNEYKILILGSKPYWRDINNPWSHLAKIQRIPPILIDEHLYWVVEPEPGYTSRMTLPADIMEFDIRNEEFVFISSPVPGKYRCREDNINIFDVGGLLSLVWTSPSQDPPFNKPFEVNIWTLKDRTTQLWTMSSYSINTDPFYAYRRPMALVNDELLVHDERALYTCNLKLGTLRKFEDERDHPSFLTTHVMSIVSLRGCKSQIYMDKRVEVEKKRRRRSRWDMSGGVDGNPVTTSE